MPHYRFAVRDSDRFDDETKVKRLALEIKWRSLGEATVAILLYLPSYSPDLNPIERAFSKLKAHLCKAAEGTVSGLLRRIGRVLDTFTARECTNFLRHAGYVRT